jgi:hypothetical protein
MGKGFFLSRDPVLAAAEFIGREAELAWIADKLSRPAPQNCNLVGEPRIGKTSLLHHVYRKQIGLPPGANGLYVWVRPVQLPAADSLSFWQLMGRRLRAAGEAAGIPVPAAEPNGGAARPWFDLVDEMVDDLAMRGWRTIFLIDDFDLLPGQITAQDLNWLRSLSTRYGETLAFVIASADSLVTLSAMVGEETAVSPFANIFHTLHLGLLTRPAAAALCRRAAEAEQTTLSADDVAFLLREAGRHPALLKIAAGFLLEQRRLGRRDDPDALYTDAASYLRFDGQVRWLCRCLIERRNSAEQAALCALADGQAAALAADPILRSRLQNQLGLVEERQGQLTLFADAFQYWACPARREMEAEAAGEEKTAVLPPLTHLPERRRVRIDGDEIPLTPLENRLLSYLAEHAGQICAREELLENVWDPGRSLAVVEKAVNRLRGKIEPDPKRPRYILSARGEGYVLRQT